MINSGATDWHYMFKNNYPMSGSKLNVRKKLKICLARHLNFQMEFVQFYLETGIVVGLWKKVFLKFTRKHLCWSLFLNKVAVLRFFYKTPLATASIHLWVQGVQKIQSQKLLARKFLKCDYLANLLKVVNKDTRVTSHEFTLMSILVTSIEFVTLVRFLSCYTNLMQLFQLYLHMKLFINLVKFYSVSLGNTWENARIWWSVFSYEKTEYASNHPEVFSKKVILWWTLFNKVGGCSIELLLHLNFWHFVN